MGLFLPQSYVHKGITVREQAAKALSAKLKKDVQDLIQRHYPEHLFTVEVDPANGNILLDHPLLNQAKARYFCAYKDFNEGKGVLKLCGEILERVNLPRGELKFYEEYDDAAALAKTQFNAR